MYQIRQEQPADQAAIHKLHECALGPGRFALSAYRLREGVAPIDVLCHVAVSENDVLGSIRFSPVRVGSREALLLGPLAVVPGHHGTGIGLELLRSGIDACRKSNHSFVILVGDEPYYARVGFRKLGRGQVDFPGPVDADRLLGLCLGDESLEDLCGPVTRVSMKD